MCALADAPDSLLESGLSSVFDVLLGLSRAKWLPSSLATNAYLQDL